jgi:hypothetical protein
MTFQRDESQGTGSTESAIRGLRCSARQLSNRLIYSMSPLPYKSHSRTGRATLLTYFLPLFSPRWPSNGRRIIICCHRFEYAIKLSHLPNLNRTHRNLLSLLLRSSIRSLARQLISLPSSPPCSARKSPERPLSWSLSTLQCGDALGRPIYLHRGQPAAAK